MDQKDGLLLLDLNASERVMITLFKKWLRTRKPWGSCQIKTFIRCVIQTPLLSWRRFLCIYCT